MMKILKNAFTEIEDIKKRIERSRKVYLFLDYDGTLTDIVERPGDALPGSELIRLFKDLNNSRFRIIIISGRSLDDLEKITGALEPTNIIMAGSHGAELKNSSLLKNPQASCDKTYGSGIPEALKSIVIEQIKDIKNIIIEDKPHSLAIHYRQVEKKDIPRIEELGEHLKKLRKQYIFRFIKMKKVIEIMPEDINKGIVLEKFLRVDKKNTSKGSVLAICIGDDVTDEDLFSGNRTGINIKVTDNIETEKTIADYYLENPAEVIRFLLIISHI